MTDKVLYVEIRDSDERLLTQWPVMPGKNFPTGDAIPREIGWLRRAFGDGRTNAEALALPSGEKKPQ